MRIGQLARRLGVSPSDVLGFLGNQDIDTNSRLDQETVERVINHFAPGKPEVSIEEPEADETPVPPVAEEQPTEETPLEVIRVSKVELQGLKVLGKIDLPEPKKKAEPAPEQQPEQQSDQQPGKEFPKKEFQKKDPKEFPRRNNRRDRDWINPLEAKRQQEAREAEKRRRENAEKQKEKRTNHYYSKVKSVPTKAVRRFEEQTTVEDVETKEPPKGLIARFLKWLRD